VLIVVGILCGTVMVKAAKLSSWALVRLVVVERLVIIVSAKNPSVSSTSLSSPSNTPKPTGLSDQIIAAIISSVVGEFHKFIMN
ncbi:412_t:CDS:2, partial [Funneliformis mosseae]